MTNPGNTPRSAAQHYDDFFGPLYFEPYALEVARRIKNIPADIVLEIAAGTGRVTRHIRQAIPSTAKLIASDIDEDMLAIAKNKLPYNNITWQNIDAQELPFSDNSIDLIICCFGYMYVPDRSKAFQEVYRVLKNGGRFLFTTWDKLEANGPSFVSRTIAEEYLSEPVPDSHNTATSMSDETLIRPTLKDAGFDRFSIEKVKLLSGSITAKEAAAGFVNGGGVYDEIYKQHPGSIREIQIRLEEELTRQFGAAPMVAPISAVMTEAWK